LKFQFAKSLNVINLLFYGIAEKLLRFSELKPKFSYYLETVEKILKFDNFISIFLEKFEI
tara:strand:- start:350 stop:529 length:180 start_codon:yes stop_codon:yes gene_type:complete